MLTYKCTIDNVTYHNEENGYSVLRCTMDSGKHLTVVGSFAEVSAGAVVEVNGNWVTDSKYGEQFKSESYSEHLPATVNGIKKFLGGGIIKGIGPTYAERIVDHFGEETLSIIDESPERLMDVSGIGEIRVRKIVQSWEDAREVKNIVLFLNEHNVSTAFASKIYRRYGAESIKKLKENPYQLAEDVWGIGFKTADKIAYNLGIKECSPDRVRSGILYTLNRLSDNGHCFASREELMENGANILNVDSKVINAILEKMVEDADVIQDEDSYYAKPFFYSEWGVAKKLSDIQNAPMQMHVAKENSIALFESESKITLDETQREAIETAMDSKVFVLTGGPGTGKTTITKGIVDAYRRNGMSVVLAAPTGRASMRMTESIGFEAKTIHRLLEYMPPHYQKNEDNPLCGDVLVVDECSMIDVHLMNALLKAVPQDMILVLVGDADQLPSVGAGNVFKDIIDSECFPVVRLTKIFRQSNRSQIVEMAHRVNSGGFPKGLNDEDSDFHFFTSKKGLNNDEIAENVKCGIVDLVVNILPKKFDCSPKDIQILTPMQKTKVGAVVLNELIQEAINPHGDSLSYGSTVFRVGDKVMQIRNNYDKGVFNGDVGEIVDVDTFDKVLWVNFNYDDKKVGYEKSELDELRLAYAVTIHKSQGSEYPIVVMPITMSHYPLLQRNLLYTGITRAKKELYLIGDPKAAYRACSNAESNKRNTKLSERIKNINKKD